MLRGTFTKAYQKKIHYNLKRSLPSLSLQCCWAFSYGSEEQKAKFQIHALSLSSGSNLMQLNSLKQFSKQIRLLTKLCDYTTHNSRNTHCIVTNNTPFHRLPLSPRQHSQYKMCLHSLNTFWHYTRDYTTGETGMTSASSPHFHPFPAQNK